MSFGIKLFIVLEQATRLVLEILTKFKASSKIQQSNDQFLYTQFDSIRHNLDSIQRIDTQIVSALVVAQM